MPTYDAGISSGGAGSFTLRFVTSENTQEGSNTSTVGYTLTIIKNSGFAFNLDPTSTWNVSIDGQNFSGNFSYDLRTATSVQIASGTSSAIAHNTDGSKSITVRGSFTGPGPLTGGDTGNQTMVLTDFVRVPNAPASISVTTSTRSATVTSGVATVSGPAVTSYEVQRTPPDSTTFSGTISTMSGSRQFTYTNLDGGKTYRFRVRARNSEGAGDWRTSGDIFVPAGGKRWTGSAWTPTATAKRWTGSAWTDLTIARRWNGSAWIDLT
jgi:hypothetical protein